MNTKQKWAASAAAIVTASALLVGAGTAPAQAASGSVSAGIVVPRVMQPFSARLAGPQSQAQAQARGRMSWNLTTARPLIVQQRTLNSTGSWTNVVTLSPPAGAGYWDFQAVYNTEYRVVLDEPGTTPNVPSNVVSAQNSWTPEWKEEFTPITPPAGSGLSPGAAAIVDKWVPRCGPDTSSCNHGQPHETHAMSAVQYRGNNVVGDYNNSVAQFIVIPGSNCSVDQVGNGAPCNVVTGHVRPKSGYSIAPPAKYSGKGVWIAARVKHQVSSQSHSAFWTQAVSGYAENDISEYFGANRFTEFSSPGVGVPGTKAGLMQNVYDSDMPSAADRKTTVTLAEGDQLGLLAADEGWDAGYHIYAVQWVANTDGSYSYRYHVDGTLTETINGAGYTGGGATYAGVATDADANVQPILSNLVSESDNCGCYAGQLNARGATDYNNVFGMSADWVAVYRQG